MKRATPVLYVVFVVVVIFVCVMMWMGMWIRQQKKNLFTIQTSSVRVCSVLHVDHMNKYFWTPSLFYSVVKQPTSLSDSF